MSEAVFPIEDTKTVEAKPQGSLLLLLKMRYQLLRNHITQGVTKRPLNVIMTIGTILCIYLGLYVLFSYTFYEVGKQPLEGIVAIPLVFTFFFLALTAMLAFSNAILSYGGLFRRAESDYLLSLPVNPREIVIVKYVESLLLSSWSLLLLGIPLMMAMARTFDEPWSFYPLFLGLFLFFIPLPGALGMVLAWLVAMAFPRSPRKTIILGGIVVAIIGGVWLWRLAYAAQTSGEWLTVFYDRVAIVQNAMLPHNWVSKGISHAVQGRTSQAAFYLMVTSANALMVSVVSIGLVGRWFLPAFTKAHSWRGKKFRRPNGILAWIGEVLFAYLPQRQRLLASKDLKTFFRDPLQWMQMAILFGLLLLYAANVHKLWSDLFGNRLQILIAFLNLTAVSLILATFTSRFVFPLISLECQQLWLLGLLPLARSRIITSKFLYALTITFLAGIAVMWVSIIRLQLPGPLAAAHMISMVAICIGLCGTSIGMGARLPVFGERNPARIAGGFGGTISLMLSVGLVLFSLAGVAIMSLQLAGEYRGNAAGTPIALWVGGVVLINILSASVAMFVGIRHFKRLQC
jgi:ABC-2 type transport system permease protein